MKIISKLNHILFATLGGKIFISVFAGFGILSLAASLMRYNYAYKLVKEARQKAVMAEQEWRGTPLSRDVVYKDFPNVRGKGYVENLYTGKKTIDKVEWVRPICGIIAEPDTLAVFSRFEKGRSSRKGYMNIYTGEVAIPDTYKHAWNFKDGEHAVVCMENDSLYVINRDGKVISRGFKSSNQLRFGFVFNDGVCIMESNDGKFGLINPNGDWVLNPKYNEITRNPRTGVYIIMQNNLYGVIDKDMKPVLPVKFKAIDFYDQINEPQSDAPLHYRVGYWVENQDGTRGYYDKDARLITESPYIELNPLRYNWYQNENGDWSEKTSDYVAYRVGDKWGLMSKRGIRITPPIYDWLYAIDADRFEATIDKNVKIIIDENGKEIPLTLSAAAR